MMIRGFQASEITHRRQYPSTFIVCKSLANRSKNHNSGYNFYNSIINTGGNLDHPWYKAFDRTKDKDYDVAASRAMSWVATGDVLVFGGARYKTDGPESYFARHEIGHLHAGLRNGRISSINHMEKGATRPSQVLATEDADGNFSFKNGHQEGDENASGSYGVCNLAIETTPIIGPVLTIIDAMTCDAPETEPKAPAEPKPSKGMALSVAMVTSIISHGIGASVTNEWKFYTTKVNKAVGSCGETEGVELQAESNDKPRGGENADPKNPPFPGGTFKLNIEGEACTYKSSGDNAGNLSCPDREISCAEDDKKSKEEGMLQCGSNQFFHAVVHCNF